MQDQVVCRCRRQQPRQPLPWLLHASEISSRVFFAQVVDDHCAVEQLCLPALYFRAAALNFLKPLLRDREIRIKVQAFKERFGDEGAGGGIKLHGVVEDFLALGLL